jgi:predicted  nucleic acid-binding Zn-ribbon protein
MDWQPYINLILGSALAIAGWFARQVWGAVQSLKEDIQDLEIRMPSEYVRKNDLNDALRRIDSTLERIEKKLDAKADK